MDRGHSGAIVVLLMAILYVLFVGREAAQQSLESAGFWFLVFLVIAVPIAIIIVVIWGIYSAFRNYYLNDLLPRKQAGRPWLYGFALFAAGLTLSATFGVAIFAWLIRPIPSLADFLWLVGAKSPQEALGNATAVLMTGMGLVLASLGIATIESLIIWARKKRTGV